MRRATGFRVPEQLVLPWSPQATVSCAHAARLLDVSLRTVMRMCESGELKAYKVRKGKTSSPWRINYDFLIEYVEGIHKEHGLETRF